MRERPIIGLDIDGIFANMAQTMVTIYNYKSICEGSPPFIKNDVYVVEDLIKYDFKEFIGRECFFEIAKFMEMKKVCSNLPLYKNAQNVYSELKSIGDVVFITKPFSLYRDWCAERNMWVLKNFGAGPEDIIYTSKKYLVDADILIDDCGDVLEDWSKYTKKPAIKANRPWNTNCNFERVTNVDRIELIPEVVNQLLGNN